MDNYATTIAIFSCQAEDRNKVSMKIGNQNLIEKTAATLYDAMSGFIIAIVVALFTLLIKFNGSESLSGFCYPNKFKKNDMKPINENDVLNKSIVLMENRLAVKLAKANKKLICKNLAIEKNSSELILANKELIFQYNERGNLNAELIIANKQLAFQYGEKDKRSEELIIANRELSFQNEANKKNAVELIIARREIAMNKLEKDIRASELIVANKKIDFKNQERDIKSAELNIANRELKKAEENQKEYIKGLEEMMFMTSHKVRQPIANIIGFSNILDQSINSPDELKQSVDCIKESAVTLDVFTKELSTFIFELGQKGKDRKDK